MKFSEKPLVFDCLGEKLLGIIALPEWEQRTGVLIVVGGPQYRVGSHRQFLLLSRRLAAAGYPVMRFDYRGMGDSSGEQRDFEAVDDDIAAAVEAFMANSPGLERIVLWGLCDAASANLLYLHAHKDERLGGLVLLNPWVRSQATLARAHIKHYYAQRLLQPAFWRKLLSGQLGIWRAVSGFLGALRRVRQQAGVVAPEGPLSYQERMLRGFSSFRGATLIILSGNDYTAKEFIENTRASQAWTAVLSAGSVAVEEVPDADHTFSCVEWRTQVERLTLEWLAKFEN